MNKRSRRQIEELERENARRVKEAGRREMAETLTELVADEADLHAEEGWTALGLSKREAAAANYHNIEAGDAEEARGELRRKGARTSDDAGPEEAERARLRRLRRKRRPPTK